MRPSDGTRDAAAADMKSLLVLAVGLLLGGCAAPTSVTQTWHAPVSANLPSMHRVLVFAARMDEAHRRRLEESFVDELAQHGVSAQPSYTLFAGEPPKQGQARAILSRNGYDGVLVASIKSIKNEHRWSMGPSAWYGNYGMAGYIETDEAVRCETSLWELRNGAEKLVWTAASKTLNPANATDFDDSITKAVVPALTQANYILPANGRSQGGR